MNTPDVQPTAQRWTLTVKGIPKTDRYSPCAETVPTIQKTLKIVEISLTGQPPRRMQTERLRPGSSERRRAWGARILRAWASQQARGEEHRLRDPVHVQTERNGASDRSRASGAGVGYFTDHTDHAVYRQEEQRWIVHDPE